MYSYLKFLDKSITMRRASSKFTSQLGKLYRKSQISLVSRDFSQKYDYENHSLTHLTRTHVQSCSKTRPLPLSGFNFDQFHWNTYRNFKTLVDPTSQSAPKISSRQKKVKKKLKLEDAFESADSIDEMLKTFNDMEACFEEKELGMACLKLGLKLDREGDDPEKTLLFGERALRIFEDNDDSISISIGDTSSGSFLPIAMTLQLLGSACSNLKRFSESLGYLNRANRLLSKLEGDNSCNDNHVLPIKNAVLSELFNVKTALGRREEAILDLKKALNIKEKMLDEDSRELGNANRDVAEAYVAVLNFKEALQFCSKALEIHTNHLGNNSVEVAHDRRLLGVIYTGLEEHGNALEQNQLSQKVLKKWGRSSDLLRAEIDAANMQISLGRYEEAIETLKGVIPQTDKDGEDRAMIFISMAKALSHQENAHEAKKCLEIATAILEKKSKISPSVVSEAFSDISGLYEEMNEFETAILLLKKGLQMLERLPQEQHTVGSVSARIGWLLLLTGKVNDAILYLEESAERLKESFGPKHFAVGYVYNNLGAAYMELERPQSAAQVFAYAKDIMDVSLGPNHVDSLEAYQNLSKAYAAMGSYPLAINLQEKVVEGWEGHGESAQDELDEAVRILEQLKEKASMEVAKCLLNALPPPESEDFLAENLQPVYSHTERSSSSSSSEKVAIEEEYDEESTYIDEKDVYEFSSAEDNSDEEEWKVTKKEG